MPHVRRQLSKSVPTMLECRFHRCPKASFPHWTNLEYPVNLGHDVFGDGYISFDSLRELSAVLGKFSEALLSYGIEKPKVISCTVMREAKNRSLAADQLKVRNGMNVSVLEDSEEKAYLYSEIVQKLENAEYLKNCHSLIAFIGSRQHRHCRI